MAVVGKKHFQHRKEVEEKLPGRKMCFFLVKVLRKDSQSNVKRREKLQGLVL
jgi:hypothetical protein